MPKSADTFTVNRKTWQRLYTCSYAFDHAQSKPGASQINGHSLHDHHEDNGRLVITHSGKYAGYTEGGAFHGYRLEPTKDHQDLITLRPDELEQVRTENGRFHGTLMRITGETGYYVLVGPPITFTYSREASTQPPTPQSIRHAFVSGPPSR